MQTLLNPIQKSRQLKRLHTLTPNTVPHWGLLTAGNLLPHLTDPFKIALGEVVAIPAKSFFTTRIGKFAAIYLMPRWPEGAPTHPKTNITIDGRKGGDFEQDKKELIEAIDRFILFYSKIPYHEHPIFGKISNRTWGEVMNKHLDHHFRQFGL
jgi:hypothetical protein